MPVLSRRRKAINRTVPLGRLRTLVEKMESFMHLRMKLPALLSTPLGLVLVFCTLVGVVELLIMAVAQDIMVPAYVSAAAWDYIDAAMLACVVGPILYLLVFQNMQRDLVAHKRAAEELHRSEEQFRRLSQISPVGIFHADAHGACTYVNERWCEITGLTLEASLGPGWMQALHREDRERTLALWRETMSVRQYVHMEWRMQKPDGSAYWALGGATTELDSQGNVLGYIGIVNDITERKQIEEELRIAAIAFESQEGMVVTDTDGIILRVNQAFTALTGYGAEEAIGQTPKLLRSGRHDAAFYQKLWDTLKSQRYWQGEIWNRRKNGKIYAEWLTISAVTSPDGQTTHYVGTFSEITQNSEAEAEIHRLAYYDALTQLPNRRLLQDRLGQALLVARRSSRCGAILFLDLDNFKILNDTRGHEIGDMLLLEVARRLHACLRGSDTVARLGGDEFVVLLEDLSKSVTEASAQSRLLGDKLLEAIAQPYRLKGIEYHCTGSIGISLFCDTEITVDELLKRADLAMYEAKSVGRNALCFFDPEMQRVLDRDSALANDLRQACTRQELRLYYQPQIDSVHGIVGAEALLRWQHPERGLVMPGDFITLAEETGLIRAIGRWVIETACAQIKAWESGDATRDLQLAINVSARQFRQPDFVAQVQQVLNQSGANPARLKIELTESVVLENVADAIAKMEALKAIGIGLSMDDFGTGYSSLSYLKQLPLDQLKIDRSFITHLASDSGDAAIVKAIITLGQTFGMSVIAEGVETGTQRDFLQQNGCHLFQGYLFGRPVILEEFERHFEPRVPTGL